MSKRRGKKAFRKLLEGQRISEYERIAAIRFGNRYQGKFRTQITISMYSLSRNIEKTMKPAFEAVQMAAQNLGRWAEEHHAEMRAILEKRG